jgi:hypothetical protein
LLAWEWSIWFKTSDNNSLMLSCVIRNVQWGEVLKILLFHFHFGVKSSTLVYFAFQLG